jgi:S-adenosylmethionine hydrolase
MQHSDSRADGRAEDRGVSSGAWRPSGVITLTTDFGLDDPYVGMMKGVILSQSSTLIVVDLTHGVPPQDVRAGAFFLGASWRYFPAGTVHVAVVDPGVGSARRILVGGYAGHCFIAPDNGLLPAALPEDARFFALETDVFALDIVSRTFHGRDLIAPAASAIAGGLNPWPTARGPVGDPVRIVDANVEHSPDRRRVVAQVVVVDHFGNVVLGITARDLKGPLATWFVVHSGRAIGFADTYSQVEPGSPLALVDSFGAIEIAVRDGHAARTLGLAPGDHVTFERRA